ncbi:MAG: ribonuclease HII [Bowdeniella nasicola]|nr:ribonuclease HII [Bowdeniella nasicola]
MCPRPSDATRDVELNLLRTARAVIGLDEVGRGALAGPVSVGAAIIDDAVGPAPAGLTDSKLLTPTRRSALVEPVRAWARAHAVGHASPAEIDEVGIIAALRLAAVRAMRQALAGSGVELPECTVLLDGSHNWLTRPADLLTEQDDVDALKVTTRVKADRDCAVVAAASILAKVERDRLMSEVVDPGYGFAEHKGYGSAAHRDAIARLGPGVWHRRSWKLLG